MSGILIAAGLVVMLTGAACGDGGSPRGYTYPCASWGLSCWESDQLCRTKFG